MFYLQSSIPHFHKRKYSKWSFKKVYYISELANSIYFQQSHIIFVFFHLDLAVFNSSKNGTKKCRMGMKWKSWDVIWGLFNYNVLPALLPKMQPISVHLCLTFSYICYRMQIFYIQIKTSYRIRSIFNCIMWILLMNW